MPYRLSYLPIAILLLIPAISCKGRAGRSSETSSRKEHFRCLLPGDATLQAGDVVFRRGGGLTSHVVLAVDHEGNYSHVGIVVDSCGTKLIVHAVPGERDFEGDVDRVKADLPERFFSTEFTSIGEVCRPADSVVAERAASIAWQAYKRHTLFDHSYDDADTTRLYCTELVVYAFSRAGHDIVEGRGHHINLPILQADCVFPSDIYVSDFLTSVSQF